MINTIHVLGKEIQIGIDLHESEVNDKVKFMAILRDLDPAIAERLNTQEFAIRIEGDTVVAYRIGAIMG